MRIMSGLSAWLAAGAFACAAPLLAAAELSPIAHSAHITVEGSVSASGLTLRVRPTSPGGALTVSDVAVAVDGTSERAVPQPDGTWLAPLPRGAGAGRLDVFVVHDGLREVLSGRIGAPPAGAPATRTAPKPGLLGAHKQMAWWILNVVVVLIGVLAISRRMS
jgi:hypothetical protein